MAYAPKTWQNGEVIGADDLNHLEQGVASAVGSSGGGPGYERLRHEKQPGVFWRNVHESKI